MIRSRLIYNSFVLLRIKPQSGRRCLSRLPVDGKQLNDFISSFLNPTNCIDQVIHSSLAVEAEHKPSLIELDSRMIKDQGRTFYLESYGCQVLYFI